MRPLATLLSVAALAAGVFLYYSHSMQRAISHTQPSVTFGATTVQVEIASTPAQQEQGLSGRASLAQGSGMLFVFDPDAAPGFWMKDMNFPLDIIFMKDDGEVAGVEQNLAPDTYPQAFYPPEPIRYALEVPAGFAAAHDITEGSAASVHI